MIIGIILIIISTIVFVLSLAYLFADMKEKIRYMSNENFLNGIPREIYLKELNNDRKRRNKKTRKRRTKKTM